MKKDTKKCSKCKKEYPLSDFPGSYKKKADGKVSKRANCKHCENKRRKESYDKNPLTGILSNIRQRCKKRGIEYDLDNLDITIPKFCPILNIPLKRGTKGNYRNSPTIDRIDPTKGYIPSNVKVISMKANNMKSDATLEELKLFIKNIMTYMNDDIV